LDDGPSDTSRHEKESIVRNLPVQDREYLLEPLEAALNDLRDIIEGDPSLFASSYEVHDSTTTGNVRFKLSGADTVLIDASLNKPGRKERFKRYWDEDGTLFIAELTIQHLGSREVRVYRIYFEEGLEKISSYGRVAFDGKPLPEEWVTICPTAEEVDYLLAKLP
jgi:hypothetical protein